MKVDLSLHHSDFALHSGSASEHLGKFSSYAAVVVKRVKEWLFAELHPVSEEEAFLGQSQNLADLERRILVLQDPNTRQSFW